MAIAFDATAQGYQPAGQTTDTFSHTCTGSNLILFVAAWIINSGGNDITGVTYAGAAMTLVDTRVFGVTTMKLFVKFGPATGANNVVITQSGTTSAILGYSTSYTGADQGGTLDNSGVLTSGAVTTFTQSLTVNTDNSWMVWAVFPQSDATLTASTNTTQRQAEYSHFGAFMADTNGLQAAGSRSMNATCPSQACDGIIASFKPVSAVVAHNLSLLGVGT